MHWDVRTSAAAPLFKALAAADFFFEGDDAGTGIFTQGPPRFIGGTNVDSGSSGGFVEVSPAVVAYQALDFPDRVEQGRGRGATPPRGLGQHRSSATPDDNAGGVEWDQGPTTPLRPATTVPSS